MSTGVSEVCGPAYSPQSKDGKGELGAREERWASVRQRTREGKMDPSPMWGVRIPESREKRRAVKGSFGVGEEGRWSWSKKNK